MLKFENVQVTLGQFRFAASFEIAQGDRLAVLGASGSGKSTLLNIAAGFIAPDRGRVIIDGTDITEAPIADRPLSILFQDSNLFPHLSVFDNVALGLSPSLRLTEEMRDRVARSLSRVSLSGLERRLPGDLSGGQASRVALARMLIRDKPLALLDEPFSALDPGLRSEMLDLIDELCVETGLTLLMVSHDFRDAERLCNRLCLLQDGEMVIEGDLTDIRADPPESLKPWL